MTKLRPVDPEVYSLQLSLFTRHNRCCVEERKLSPLQKFAATAANIAAAAKEKLRQPAEIVFAEKQKSRQTPA